MNRWEPNYGKEVLPRLLSDIGHTLPSSVADLVDNALDCKSSIFDWGTIFKFDRSFFYFYNDGHGMTFEQIKNALDIGSSDASRKQNKTVHGLYGVGLNISALRNCSSFEIHSFSNKNRISSIRQFKDKSGKLFNDKKTEIPSQLDKIFNFKNKKKGTLIIWKQLNPDLFNLHDFSSFNKEIIEVQSHLMITFNKIIKKENFDIFFMGQKLENLDPMMTKNINTQKQLKKVINLDKSKVEICPFIIPEKDDYNFTNKKQLSIVPDRKSLAGLYFYRHDRAVKFGGWNDLITSSRLKRFRDSYERIRIEINFERDSDKFFKINPTKQGLYKMPELLNNELISIIEGLANKISTKKKNTNKIKGIVSKNSLWKMLDGKPTIDFNNNEVKNFTRKFPETELFLKKISRSIPLIYPANLEELDFQNHNKSIIDIAVDLVRDLQSDDNTLEQAIELVCSRKPFIKNKDLSDKLKEALNDQL